MCYDEHKPLAYVESLTASLFLEDPADVTVYRGQLVKLAGLALDGGQSRAWLADLASEYDQPEDARRCPIEKQRT